MLLLTLLLSVLGLVELFGVLGDVQPEVLSSLFPGSGIWFSRIPLPLHVLLAHGGKPVLPSVLAGLERRDRALAE